MVRQENIAAFLKMIRLGEGTTDEDGYRRMFGGDLFESFADHPRIANRRRCGRKGYITSTAAGAYQFLSKTWDMCQAKLKLTDFSPASQDKAATYLIERRGALGDVVGGRIVEAIEKCNKEWASLPGSPYGQPTVSLKKAIGYFKEMGGLTSEDEENGRVP